MKSKLICFLLMCTALNAAAIARADDSLIQLAPDVTIHPLAQNIWMHTSTHRYPGGVIIPSNGLIIESDLHSILIDTAWNDEQTRLIFNWAANTLHKPISLAIVTHAHNDRIGGVGFLLSRDIPVMGLTMTRDLAKTRKLIGPNQTFDLTIGQTKTIEGLELFYPGPGHAADNIVVWLPAQRILFGGCLIKSADANNLGFTGDADMNHWPIAVEAVKARYISATIIVPGDQNLLPHTQHLLAGAASTTQPTNPELLH